MEDETFTTLRTLMPGAEVRAKNQVRQTVSIELIEQKIAESQAGLRAAKAALTGLIQPERSETRAIRVLETRLGDLPGRATEDRVHQLEEARKERLLADFVTDQNK